MRHYNFCTLLDKGFLTRGVAIHQSLIEQCPNFTFYILCIDEESFEMLDILQLKNVKLIHFHDVEDDQLLAVKSTRKPVEYYWMFSSSLPLYLLEQHPDMDSICYIDVDMYFYAPVDAIYDEFGNNSIMIIPHRYSEQNKHCEKTSGIYNVTMTIFKNDQYALECLRWWKDRCIEWCFDYYDNGKLGDQLYLNDWPTRFKNVHILEHPGANIASWNIDRYIIDTVANGFSVTDKVSGTTVPLIFYHFHGLKLDISARGRVRFWPITVYEKAIYKHYRSALQVSYDRVRVFNPNWLYGGKKLDILRQIKQYIIRCLTRKI